MCCRKGPHAHVIALGIFAQGLSVSLAKADPPGAPPASPRPAPSAPPDPPPAIGGRGRGAPDTIATEVRAIDTSAPAAASEVTVSHRELALRPHLRAEDVLEAVPGLVTVQHSGGAKAQQYFLRGFDADHGTDIAFFVDGVPVNAVSHAHGQGYSDFHFLIPEVVSTVTATKGPYAARFGDFATAGAVELRLVDRVPENLAQLEMGDTGRTRALALASPDFGQDWRAVAAVEVFSDPGHFVHAEDHRRLNAFGRVTRLFDRSELSLTWMQYGASWNASGEIPARMVCGERDGSPPPEAYGARCIGRFDSVDPTQGGRSQRTLASIAWAHHGDDVELGATAYLLRSKLQLFLDETFLADDPVHGGGTEQYDARITVGATAHASHATHAFGVDFVTRAGLEVRHDGIDAALYGQEQRRRFETRFSSRIDESALGGWVDEELRPATWLRFVAGARVDGALASVSGDGAAHASQALASPKATVVVTPAREVDLFADYGRGFHSNDARAASSGPSLLAVATGYELGVRVRPLRHLVLSASAFLLDLSSELVFDGDAATTEPAGRTRREGVELAARYHLGPDVFADAALTLTRARFRDDDGQGTSVPLAPPRTFSAGVGARKTFGDLTPFGSVRVRSIADRPATQDGALVAPGFTLVDAEAGLRWKDIEGAVTVMNALDADWREGQFAITSRMPYEPRPVTAMSFSPGWPREVLARATLYF